MKKLILESELKDELVIGVFILIWHAFYNIWLLDKKLFINQLRNTKSIKCNII